MMMPENVSLSFSCDTTYWYEPKEILKAELPVRANKSSKSAI
jgi:hypothetical protein